MTALCIPDQDDRDISWTEPTDIATGVWLSRESVNLLEGNTVTLSAAALPWMLTDRDVTWTSADPQVATVNAKGVITAVAPGKTMVTAASKLDPTKTAQCAVTVDTVEATVKGVLQDVDGSAWFFDWNLETAETWNRGNPLDTNISSATLDPVNHKLYVMDSVPDVWAMHRVDPATGTIEADFANEPALPLWDMAYSEFFSTEDAPSIFSICESALIAPYPVDAVGAELYFNLYAYLESVGAGYLVAVTSAGYEQYHDTKTGKVMDTERVVALDNAGNVWTVWVYQNEKMFPSDPVTYGGIIQHTPSTLDLEFPGAGDNIYSSMVMGEDGTLFLSAFTGETNELYRLIYNETLQEYEANRIGDVGQEVWPAALYAVESNSREGANGLPAPNAETAQKIEAQPLTGEEAAAIREAAQAITANCNMNRTAGSVRDIPVRTEEQHRLNLAAAGAATPEQPTSGAIVGEDGETVTVTITAKDAGGNDVASTNGLVTVTYDDAKLSLENVAVYGGYTAKTESSGSVTLGYVNLMELPAGKAVATLTFRVQDSGANAITVEHRQVGNEKPNYTEELPFDCRHTETEVVNAKEATCTEDGYTGDTVCKTCGKVLENGEAIPALGHDFSVKGETVPPTCIEDGYTVYQCSRCEETQRRDIVPATGEHTYGQWQVTKEATCTEPGEQYRECAVCHETETEEIPALGHDFSVKGETVPPTCAEDGYTVYQCSRCEETQRRDILPATGEHTYGQWQVVKEATCTETGEETCTCTVCGQTLTRETAAKGHAFGEWVITAEPDCFHEGARIRECASCGETQSQVLAKTSEHCPAKAFTDLDTTVWYHESVDYVLGSGLMEGMGGGIFAPNAKMTRAQLVTVLYRLAGSPTVEETAPFRDVPANTWYAKAVAWAYGNGVTNGVAPERFNPNAPVTREQMVTLFARYAGMEGKETTALGDLSAFTDGNAVSAYARDSMVWAVEAGLIQGVENNAIAPKNAATRAQVATILMRYCEILG